MKDKKQVGLHVSFRSQGIDLSVVKKGHFVGTSGLHFGRYYAKELLVMDPLLLNFVGAAMAKFITETNRKDGRKACEVIIGISPNSSLVSTYVAFTLARENTHFKPINMYAEYKYQVGVSTENLEKKLVLRSDARRLIAGRTVFLIEDVVSTGKSLLELRKLVESHGGIIVGACCVCLKNSEFLNTQGFRHFFALESLNEELYNPIDCPMCNQKIEIDIDYGHGGS